ncbi:MAG: nucleotidyltransferase family protein [Clostridiaceae bacterium]|nr:nucleotidyltransferase family protein [Clostridiaceae bacterium]
MSDLMKIKEYFLACVAAVINGGDVPALPEDVDAEKVYNLAVRNSAQALLYFANGQGKMLPDDVAVKLKKAYQAAMLREMSQQSELDKIRKEFTENDIPFMLLKGSHLKALYPKPEMRFMVDMDVLVRKEDVEKARDILLSHGLKQEMNNGKDIVLIKAPFLTVELHNTLFTEDYYMYEYFLGVWDRAVKIGDYEYKMSDSDLYIYTLAHLAEHYTNAGACFRPTVDLYLMNKKLADSLDCGYIEAELEKLGLNSFNKNIISVGKSVFEGEDADENIELMENYIVFGPPVKNAAEVAAANESKAKRIVKMLFPNLRHMQHIFPILEKLPFLLPLFWVIRFFRYAFTKKAREKLKAVNSADTEQYNTLRKIYEDSGLTKY